MKLKKYPLVNPPKWAKDYFKNNLNVSGMAIGGGIHIKKKNRGTFTKYCDGKVTQACIDKAKRSGNKKLIKRAVFAENSRKWAKKHLIGGVFTKIPLPSWYNVHNVVPPLLSEEQIKEQEEFKFRRDLRELENTIYDNLDNFKYQVLSKYPNTIIPFIKDKQVVLTNAGKDTGAIFSTNMLDSIAKYANAAGLPLKSALGLAGLESTFGNGYGFIKTKVDPQVLISNWNWTDQNPWKGLFRLAAVNARDRNDDDGRDDKKFYDNLLKGYRYAENQEKKILNNLKHPLQHGFELYKTGKYNLGDPEHTQMVEERGEALMKSPEIQKWLHNKTYLKIGGN